MMIALQNPYILSSIFHPFNTDIYTSLLATRLFSSSFHIHQIIYHFTQTITPDAQVLVAPRDSENPWEQREKKEIQVCKAGVHVTTPS
jgi:hypothetical protein